MVLIDGELSSKKENDLPSSGTELPALGPCHEQNSRNHRLLSQRKIKSRDAARNRRGRENYEFYELAKLLPIPAESATQLDKASIIRLTMCFLQIRDIYSSNPDWKMADDRPPPNRTVKDASAKVNSAPQQAAVSKIMEEDFGTHVMQSLDGFMLVLSCHGRIVYVSETVSLFLGLSQVEMIGSSLFDYICSDDTNELALNLGLSLSSVCGKEDSCKISDEMEADCTRSFFVRMKSAIAKRGVGQKSSCFKVVHLCTRTQPNILNCGRRSFSGSTGESPTSSGDFKSETTGIVAFGTTLPSVNFNGLPLNENAFVMRTNSSLQITYCEVMVENLLGYGVHEILGKSLYHCVHTADVERLKSSHVNLLSKGHVETPYVRWLHKSKGFRWICSSVMLMPNQRVYPERSFIWIHTVISDVINSENVVYQCQPPPKKLELAKTFHTPVKNENEQKKPLEVPNCEGFAESLPPGDETNKIEPKPDVKVSKTPKTVKLPHKLANQDELHEEVYSRNTGETSDTSNGYGSPTKATVNHTGSQHTEIPAKRSRIESSENGDVDHESKSSSEQISPGISRDPKYDARLQILCVEPRLAEQLQQPPLRYADFVSEYMDIDSTYWSNPPNKEISNHNDLPAGIKEMEGQLSARRVPSAVHHHYPFGINPALFRSNPLFSKLMAAGWANVHAIPATETFMLTAPVGMVPSYHIPNLCDRSKLPLDSSVLHTPASVSAVLEELKKDPLHKVNPPNKVVVPNLEESGFSSSHQISGCRNLLHSVSLPANSIHRAQQTKGEAAQSSNGTSDPDQVDAKSLPCVSSVGAPVTTTNLVNAQTIFHVPSALLVSGNGVLLGGSDAPLIGLTPSPATLRLPIATASFSQRLNPCMMQAIAFPQIAKVRSIPF